MGDWLIEIGKIIGPSALTAVILMKGFASYINARAKESDARETKLIELLAQHNELMTKVEIILDKLMRNGNGHKN